MFSRILAELVFIFIFLGDKEIVHWNLSLYIQEQKETARTGY